MSPVLLLLTHDVLRDSVSGLGDAKSACCITGPASGLRAVAATWEVTRAALAQSSARLASFAKRSLNLLMPCYRPRERSRLAPPLVP